MTTIQKYVDDVGPVPLPPIVCEKIFEQYIAGATLAEITKLFPEYTREAVLYSAWKYNWPTERDNFVVELQTRMRQKVMYSKFQQLELVSNMIQVAHIEACTAMQAYIKHPCDRNLPKTLRIKTIKDLSMAIEMMASITGQDNNKTVKVDGEVQMSNSIIDDSSGKKALTSELATELLKQISGGKVSVKE